MIRGYVSSDEDDYDDYDYDFGYSDPLILTDNECPFPKIQTKKVEEVLHSALEKSKKIQLFLEAVDSGNLRVLEDLITLGVSPDSTDTQKWTALMKACASGNFSVVQFLLENGADPNKHRELFTPLMTCCTHTLVAEDPKLNCVRLLLQNGAAVNAKDKYRTTALMYACGSGYTDIVTEFLGVPGIDINVQDKEGWTALFYAVNHNDINLVKKLVSAGSDLKLKDKYDRTSIDLALDKDFKELAAMLGYVEEQLPISSIQQPSERFLKELPDSEGQGGFNSDAQNILHAFNQFNVKSTSLSDLLNATDKDLYDIGVKLQPDRQKILSQGIHRYHLKPWSASSMCHPFDGAPMSLEDAVVILGGVANHLTTANASLRYLDSRISSRENKDTVNLAIEKETVRLLLIAYDSAKRLSLSLMNIIERIEKIKPEEVADYIYPYEEEKCKGKFLNFFWYAVAAAATAGFVICNWKSDSRFKKLIKFIFYPVLSFLPVFQSEYVVDSCDDNSVVQSDLKKRLSSKIVLLGLPKKYC